MSKISAFLQKIPRDRKTLMLFYGAFSAAWVAWIVGYTFGYWQMITGMGGHLALLQFLFFFIGLIVPLFVIWFPIYITHGQRNIVQTSGSGLAVPKDGAILAPEQVTQINARLEALASHNHSVKAALGDILAMTSELAQRPESKFIPPINMDAPSLPLTEVDGANTDLQLADLAVALDFSDQVRKGDWAIAFEKVSAKGNFMELLRSAESVIDTFESEGVFVEDLAIDEVSDSAWRTLAKHKRNGVTEKLEAIKDRATDALIRARLKNDPSFQEIALRFQKRFLELIEQYGPSATADEFASLTKSRAGRAFILLGTISGTFKATES